MPKYHKDRCFFYKMKAKYCHFLLFFFLNCQKSGNYTIQTYFFGTYPLRNELVMRIEHLVGRASISLVYFLIGDGGGLFFFLTFIIFIYREIREYFISEKKMIQYQV